ncbi:BRCA1-A complex subunit Abraxas 1-like [Sarcophilus harrisii]|uniref:BRCA1-A complex subunit Abraxas 1 n=2 Tax=Sarcophilus harrisii TaxID=9305 RepID=G3VJZ6_SARHA
MASEEISATLSGVMLSTLAVQHVNSNLDTEGFLLGEMTEADSQLSDAQVLRTVVIQRYIACIQLFSFYNSSGEVNEQALEKIILGCEKNVIGWYKLRHNSDPVITFRERILHKNLQQHLSNQGLVFLLLTSSTVTKSCSTHRFDYVLHRLQEGLFHKVPLVVVNLATSEQQTYNTMPGPCRSAGFLRSIHTYSSEIFDEDGALRKVQKMNELCATVQEELKEMCTQVFDSEQSLEKVMQDINKLKEELAAKRPKPVISGRSGDLGTEENVSICPSQGPLHSCVVCLEGKQTASKCCTTEHNVSQVSELTESPHLAEKETKCKVKRKSLEGENPDFEKERPLKKVEVSEPESQSPKND